MVGFAGVRHQAVQYHVQERHLQPPIVVAGRWSIRSLSLKTGDPRIHTPSLMPMCRQADHHCMMLLRHIKAPSRLYAPISSISSRRAND